MDLGLGVYGFPKIWGFPVWALGLWGLGFRVLAAIMIMGNRRESMDNEMETGLMG